MVEKSNLESLRETATALSADTAGFGVTSLGKQPMTNLTTSTTAFEETVPATSGVQYVKVSEQTISEPINAPLAATSTSVTSTVLPTTITATQPAQFTSIPAATSITAPILTSNFITPSSTVYTTEILHGHYTTVDRYGHEGILKIKPKALLSQSVVFDVPCYLKTGSLPRYYLELPYPKTELAIDQQLVVHKKRWLHRSKQRWVIRNNGFIEHETNRMMVLGVHKPSEINAENVTELLVTAQNKEMIGENLTGVRWSVVPTSVASLDRKHRFFSICLASDPTWVLDIAHVSNTVDLKDGYKVVLRKNASFSDLRQKWIFKPYYPVL